MSVRIIVIDDDERIRLLYQKELSLDGYTVETAALGSEAVEKVLKGGYDVAVLDIEMPDISGLELLGRLRELAPQTRVILNSAYTIYKADFKSWLADAYLVKSSDIESLKQTIRKLTESYADRQ